MPARAKISPAPLVAKARGHKLSLSWGSSGPRAPLRAANALVYGESVGQAHELADCGCVARSHARAENGKQTRCEWLIPTARCKRLDQDAVVLSPSARPQRAKEFLHWLRIDRAAIQTIRAAGYALSKR